MCKYESTAKNRNSPPLARTCQWSRGLFIFSSPPLFFCFFRSFPTNVANPKKNTKGKIGHKAMYCTANARIHAMAAPEGFNQPIFTSKIAAATDSAK